MNATQRPLSVSAYIAHDGRAIFVPNNVTTTGLGIAGAEVITLDRPSEEELGAAALRAIGTAGRVVPHPPDQDAFRTETKRFLKSVGFRSHKALMRECSLVSILATRGEVVVTPTHNHGTSGGYEDRPADARRVAASPVAIGGAIASIAAPSPAIRPRDIPAR